MTSQCNESGAVDTTVQFLDAAWAKRERMREAAPELLAACKACLENQGDWSAAMFAAVAKAEGRS